MCVLQALQQSTYVQRGGVELKWQPRLKHVTHSICPSLSFSHYLLEYLSKIKAYTSAPYLIDQDF